MRSVVPGNHLLGVLGPRPVKPVDHAVWREAARVVDDYRARWNVTRWSDAPGCDALGTDRLVSGIASLPTERLVDHLQTSRHLEVARQRLGWRECVDMRWSEVGEFSGSAQASPAPAPMTAPDDLTSHARGDTREQG